MPGGESPGEAEEETEKEETYRSPQIGISGSDPPIHTIITSEPDKQRFEEIVEEYGFRSKSECARKLLALGMNVMLDADPRQQGSRESSSNHYNVATVREFIPEGKENSVDIRDELIDSIEEKVPEIIQNDPEITQDGWEVYR